MARLLCFGHPGSRTVRSTAWLLVGCPTYEPAAYGRRRGSSRAWKGASTWDRAPGSALPAQPPAAATLPELVLLTCPTRGAQGLTTQTPGAPPSGLSRATWPQTCWALQDAAGRGGWSARMGCRLHTLLALLLPRLDAGTGLHSQPGPGPTLCCRLSPWMAAVLRLLLAHPTGVTPLSPGGLLPGWSQPQSISGRPPLRLPGALRPGRP